MKLREIERLRACAALFVLVVHWEPLKRFLPWVLGDPWSGVDLFFVISGYVVTMSLVRLLPTLDGDVDFFSALKHSRAALKTFYVRRLFRIAPAALTVALVTRALAGAFPQAFGSVTQWSAEFVAFVGGIYNYRFGFTPPQSLTVYWSLSVEEHFYLLLPMLFIVFRTRGRRFAACAALALFSIVARAVPPPEAADLNIFGFQMYSSHLRFDSLMAGVFLALLSDLPRTTPLLPPRLVRVVLVPAVLLIIAGLPRAASIHVTHRAGFIALWLLSGLLVSYASMDQGYVLDVPILGRVLEYLGARSYAIYLVHTVISRLESVGREQLPELAKLAPDSDYPVARVSMMLAGTLIASEILYRAVERPCIALGRRIIAAEGRFTLSPWGRMALGGALAAFAAVYFRHALFQALGPKNIARGAAVYGSPHADGAYRLTDGRLEPNLGACTNRDARPWFVIDLGRPRTIGAIRVYNRDDGYQAESVPLEVQVSDDGEGYRTVAHYDLVFTQEWPWRIRGIDLTARYLRLTPTRETNLCLSEVEVFEERWVTVLP
jgi:peptidoglycan/LPS O-acetylase OafA/YrhL